MIFLSTLLISMFVTMALIPILRAGAVRLGGGLDLPDERKVHVKPVPKVGGVAMAVGALVPLLVMVDGGRFINAVLIGACIIVLFGVVDDLKNLGWAAKFAGQLIAALLVIFYGGVKVCYLGECLPEGVRLPDYLAVPLTLLAIVGVTNAINLSDGLDGLAGGISLLIFICIGWLAYNGLNVPDRALIMLLCAAVLGAIFGFLRFNTHPATVFMGDAGSQLLGFLAVTLSLGITQSNPAYSPALPLLLLGFPVLDTLTVMAERIAAGRSPFHADKNHFHHKLMRLGLYHTEAVVAIYAVTALLVTAGFLLRFYSVWLLVGVYLAFAALVVAGFTLLERSGWRFARTGFFDIEIKGRLRVVKEKAIHIRVAFFCLRAGVPALFLASALIPAEVPRYLGGMGLFFAVTIAAAYMIRSGWLVALMRIGFYLSVPLVLRLGQIGQADWVHPNELRVYHLAFFGLAACVVLTLRFTRRQKGFKATPMDFLILVIALVVPVLPGTRIQSVHVGFLTAKILVLFFGFEVLVGELRGRVTSMAALIMCAMAIVAVKGLL